jgi:ABC-type nickel/cobalt efflux system permease component RcnA
MTLLSILWTSSGSTLGAEAAAYERLAQAGLAFIVMGVGLWFLWRENRRLHSIIDQLHKEQRHLETQWRDQERQRVEQLTDALKSFRVQTRSISPNPGSR